MILIIILTIIFLAVLVAAGYWRTLYEEAIYENHKLKERIEYLQSIMKKNN